MGDLVVAEFEGAGRLSIRMADNALVTNQALNTRVAKGNPELRLSGTDSTSILRFYTMGALNGVRLPAKTGSPPRGAS